VEPAELSVAPCYKLAKPVCVMPHSHKLDIKPTKKCNQTLHSVLAKILLVMQHYLTTHFIVSLEDGTD